jgi:hypothetical protein
MARSKIAHHPSKATSSLVVAKLPPGAKSLWRDYQQGLSPNRASLSGWIEPGSERGVVFSPRSVVPKRYLFVTSDAVRFTILTKWDDVLAPEFGVMCAEVAPTVAELAVIRRETLRTRRALRFVGDLSPAALTILLWLAHGGDFSVRERIRTATEYAGIGDVWLRVAKECFQPTAAVGVAAFERTVMIEMNGEQRAFWGVLKASWPGVLRVIGPRCSAHLDEGRWVAVEALLRRESFTPEYAGRVAVEVWGIGNRAAPDA